VQELRSKLIRTQETYAKLVTAQTEYTQSARKVQQAERKLHEAAGDKVR
jgi:hypothetical protein